MIRDLVLYFLKQGSYNGPGDIAVLCAYLGQLQKVRAALRDLKISVSLDERDQEQLARQGIDEEPEFEEVFVTKHVSFDNTWNTVKRANSPIGSTRNGGYFSRTGGQDRYRVLGQELRDIRNRVSLHWVLEGT